MSEAPQSESTSPLLRLAVGVVVFAVGILLAYSLRSSPKQLETKASVQVSDLLPEINEANQELLRLTGEKRSWPKDSSSVEQHQKMLLRIRAAIERAKSYHSALYKLQERHSQLVADFSSDEQITPAEQATLDALLDQIAVEKESSRTQADQTMQQADKLLLDLVDKYFPEDIVNPDFLYQRRHTQAFISSIKLAARLAYDPCGPVDWSAYEDDELSQQRSFIYRWKNEVGNTKELEAYARKALNAEWIALGMPTKLTEDPLEDSTQSKFFRRFKYVLGLATVLGYDLKDSQCSILWQLLENPKYRDPKPKKWYTFLVSYSKAKALGEGSLPSDLDYTELQERMEKSHMQTFIQRWRERLEEYYQLNRE